MTVVWQSESSNSGALGADPVVTKPTGTADGDLLIAVAVQSSTATVTPPADTNPWLTPSGSLGSQSPIFYKIAASEPASYQFTVSGTANSVITIVRISGTSQTNPIDFVSGIAGTGTLVIPSGTASGTRFLWQMALKQNTVTWTQSGGSGFTERYDHTQGAGSTAGGDESVSGGSTGTRTWTPASGSSNGIAYMVSINSAVAETTGTAAGSGSASAQSSLVLGTAGSSSGTSSVSAQSSSVAGTIGSASGTASALAVSGKVLATAGSSSGSGSASSVGGSTASSTGSGAGTSTVTGSARATATSTGSSSGIASAVGSAGTVSQTTGTTSGSASAAGASGVILSGTGTCTVGGGNTIKPVFIFDD